MAQVPSLPTDLVPAGASVVGAVGASCHLLEGNIESGMEKKRQKEGEAEKET